MSSDYAYALMDKKGYTRCPGCPGTSAIITPDGPPDCDVLCIGDKPGKEENNRGRPFVGYTSKDFNGVYLPSAGLGRDDIRLTNSTKCFHELRAADAEKLTAICASYHLRREILAQKPTIIVPMGTAALSLIEGLNLEMHHGIPIPDLSWYGHSCTTFPTHHPASSLHQEKFRLPLRVDFTNLGRLLRGEIKPIRDEYPSPFYEELETGGDVLDVLATFGTNPYQWVAIDTESDPITGFWCLSFSMAHGTGFMIHKDNRAGLDILYQWIRDTQGSIDFHNGMYDIPVLEEIQWDMPMNRFDDTMVRAYHLQWLPQGLKYLAWRLCGMQMEEYEDVVLPHSTVIMLEYVVKLLGVDWPKPEAQQVIDSKTGEYRTYKPHGLNPKLKRMQTDFGKAKEGEKHKVFARWQQWSEEERLPAIAGYGDMPKPSIQYVPRKQARFYACRDADATGRVKSKLIQLKRMVRKSPPWGVVIGK